MARTDGLIVRFTGVPGLTAPGVLPRPLYLPAVLGDVSDTEEADHREFSTVATGQFSVGAPGQAAKQLLTTDLETLTIEWDPRWFVANNVGMAWARQQLYAILRSRKPVHMASRLRQQSSFAYEHWMLATIRRIERTLKAPEADTRYYQLSIAEWRPLAVVAAGGRPAGAPQARSKGVQLPAWHHLSRTDTLQSLSKRYYGTTAKWRRIASANAIRGWGSTTPLVNAKRFTVGSKVRIPAR